MGGQNGAPHHSTQRTFFNVPDRAKINDRSDLFFGAKAMYSALTNWRTFEDQALTKQSIFELFANRIPVARYPGFFDQEQLRTMLEVLRTHELVRRSSPALL